MSDGREEREERKRRIAQDMSEDPEDRVNLEDPEEWKPERVDSSVGNESHRGRCAISERCTRRSGGRDDSGFPLQARGSRGDPKRHAPLSRHA